MTIKLGMDNSAHSKMAFDVDAEPLAASILVGYEPLLLLMTFEESLATTNKTTRRTLLAFWRRLLSKGKLLVPPHYIVDVHVHAYHQSPATYDWKKVTVRWKAVEDDICHGNYEDDDTLSAQQRTEVKGLLDQFETFFPTPVTAVATAPITFEKWLTKEREPGGDFWGICAKFYEEAFGPNSIYDAVPPLEKTPDETQMRDFVGKCPPFDAFVSAMLIRYYDQYVRSPMSPRLDAGRNDLMMAAYLPYCDLFLTDDKKQCRCLNTVAAALKIPTAIEMYKDFRKRIMVG